MSSPTPGSSHSDKLKRRASFQDIELIALSRKSYAGGSGYLNGGFLHTHNREAMEDFINRKKRAYYLNYTAPIVDSYAFFISDPPPTREYTDTVLTGFMENCDAHGTSFATFMANTATEFFIAGRIWVAVDSPDILVKTEQELVEKRAFPYIYSIPTENVLDYAEDDLGFVWVKYTLQRERKDTWDYDGSGYETIYVVWSRDFYREFNEKGEEIAKVPNPLDFVPIHSFMLPSEECFVRDIVKVNQAIFNWCSLLDEQLYRQAFSWLIIPADPKQPLKQKKIGTSWAWTYDPNAKHEPKFISPDVAQMESLETRIQNGINEIYRLASLDREKATVQQKSGVAASYDFLNVNKTLVAVAGVLKDAELAIIRIFSMYLKTREVSFSVQYASDFNASALQIELTKLYDALTTSFSNTFLQLVAKKLSRTVLSSVSPSDRRKIDSEIEEVFKEGETPIGMLDGTDILAAQQADESVEEQGKSSESQPSPQTDSVVEDKEDPPNTASSSASA